MLSLMLRAFVTAGMVASHPTPAHTHLSPRRTPFPEPALSDGVSFCDSWHGGAG